MKLTNQSPSQGLTQQSPWAKIAIPPIFLPLTLLLLTCLLSALAATGVSDLPIKEGMSFWTVFGTLVISASMASVIFLQQFYDEFQALRRFLGHHLAATGVGLERRLNQKLRSS